MFLLDLLIIGVVVWIILSRRDPAGTREGGLPSLRRMLQYSGLLASLAAAGVGFAGVLTLVFAGEEIAGSRTTELAMGLSLTLVATPVWLLLWRGVSRTLRADVEERGSVGWALYLVAAMTGSLVVTVVNLVRLGDAVVGLEPFTPAALAFAIAAVGIWIGHLALSRRVDVSPTSTIARIGVLAGATVGLVALAVGMGEAIAVGLEEWYWAVFGPPLAAATTTVTLRHALVVAAVAAPVWWWHWLRQGRHDPGDQAWQGWLLLVAALGGLATGLTGAGRALATTLEWLLRDPVITPAAHFSDLPPAVATAAVGATIWWYHRRVLARAADGGRAEPERTYTYLASGIGMVAAATGATLSVAAAIQAAFGGMVATRDLGAGEALVWGLSLLIVGLPAWIVFWRRAQQRARTSSLSPAPIRRIYLLLVLGVATLTALVSLAVVLYAVFRDLLQRELSVEVLAELRIAIGLVVTTGAIAAYHAAVHRVDRAQVPVAVRIVRPSRVLLISPDGRQLASAVATETGARVRSLHRLDAPHLDIDAHAVSEAILAVRHPSVLVTVDADASVRVIPYEPV
ncbi:MAG: DUF5671 domain-containing protein [Egicoccus sp.]